MKRIAIAALAVLGLTACDAGIPTPGNGVGREGWYPIEDPKTGETFNCFYWSLKDSTAFWCHPITPEELAGTSDGMLNG